MSQQLTEAMDAADAEDVDTFRTWLAWCAAGASVFPHRPQLFVMGTLLGGLAVATDEPCDGPHPILVAATVTAREAAPAAYADAVEHLQAVERPAWSPLAVASLDELALADADGRRQVQEAARAAEALDGLPPELGG